MKFCIICGKPMNNTDALCMNCGTPTPGYTECAFKPDKADAGLVVLSVLIPVVGFVLWILKYSESPHAARTYGIAALITCGMFIALYIGIYIIILGMMQGFIDSINTYF